MQIRNALPPWEFLLSASRNSLQSYELSRLGHAAICARRWPRCSISGWKKLPPRCSRDGHGAPRTAKFAAASDADRAPHSEERGAASDNFFPNFRAAEPHFAHRHVNSA